MSEKEMHFLDFNEGDPKKDEALFKSIYMEFYPSLIGFAKGYLIEITLAEDIVEDVMLKLWSNRQTISAIKNLRFYLFVATKNACINYLIKIKKINSISIDDLEIEICGAITNAEENIISQENVAIINNEINKLPKKCQAIFLLVKEEKLKYREVAELLNLSVKTIESQMAIAMKRLSDAMLNEFPAFISKKLKKQI